MKALVEWLEARGEGEGMTHEGAILALAKALPRRRREIEQAISLLALAPEVVLRACYEARAGKKGNLAKAANVVIEHLTRPPRGVLRAAMHREYWPKKRGRNAS